MTFLRRPVDGALFMFDKGYKVFPLKPNGKTPSDKGWQKWAETADREKISNFGTANSNHNWGVYCGVSNLAVIDVDTKPGKVGAQSLIDLAKENNILMKDTFTVRTPTGGLHYYYSGQIKTSASLIAKDIDTRGVGGYVVAPASRIDRRLYEISNDKQIMPLQSWVSNKIEAPKLKEAPESNIIIKEGNRNASLASLAGTLRSKGLAHDAILAAISSVNQTQTESPLPSTEVETIARSIASYAPKDAIAVSDFHEAEKQVSRSWGKLNPEAIPKRPWVMKNRFIGGFISVVVAPGGVGKSTLTTLDAVSVATGKPLSGFHISNPGPVWIYNTEDPDDELDLKGIALAEHHGLTYKEIEDVQVTSGRKRPLILVKSGKDGVAINQSALDETIAHIKEKNIKLLIVDPFVRTHECNENDNMQIDKVVWCFQRIADATKCAVCLVHHTRKPGVNGGAAGDMNQARGASSLINAARVAHTLNPMSEEEAEKFGVPREKRLWYMRLDNAKANLQPPAERADWYRKVNVKSIKGDDVGTVERIDLTSIREEKADEALMAERYDLARCLESFMINGRSMSMRECIKRSLDHEIYSYIFLGFKSPKSRDHHFLRLADKNLSYYDSDFLFDDRGVGAKPRYYIKCVKRNVEDLNFLS